MTTIELRGRGSGMASQKITVPEGTFPAGTKVKVVPDEEPSGARKPYEPEIVNAGEAAAMCGVTRNNFWHVTGLPEPYGRSSGGVQYRVSDILPIAERLAAKRERERAEAEAQ